MSEWERKSALRYVFVVCVLLLLLLWLLLEAQIDDLTLARSEEREQCEVCVNGSGWGWI